MGNVIRLVGPNRAVEILGVKLVGVNAENGLKFVFTLGFIALVLLLGRGLQALTRRLLRGRGDERAEFWARQGVRLVTTVMLLMGLVSIWFDDPTRLATALGLVTAGLAFALQRVVTALAGYFVILRGRTFNVGDRITMGGVRGDVIALGFLQTTIMEMGQPPSVQNADPAMWVRGRQYLGPDRHGVQRQDLRRAGLQLHARTPLPLGGDDPADRLYGRPRRAERILRDVAERHTVRIEQMGEESLREMQRRVLPEARRDEPEGVLSPDGQLAGDDGAIHRRGSGVRDLKDVMSREILAALDETGIGIASATFEIFGLPPIRLRRSGRDDGEGAGPTEDRRNNVE